MKRSIKWCIDLAAVLVILWSALAMVPLRWFWYAPGTVIVSDSTVATPPSILFDRRIKRPVRMSYQVVIRRVGNDRIVCDPASGPFTYRPTATLPKHMDIIWWTGADMRCWPRAPGTYVMETCWTASRPFGGLVPPKTECRDSNPFSIHPKE